MSTSQFSNVSVSEVRVDNLLRINPHVDGGWFWSKYSANPYAGCQYGCSYCFLRQRSYGLAGDDEANRGSDSFAQSIQVRINAGEVLDLELAKVPPDVIVTGDYQPVDSRFRISRRLLEVCLKRGFPVLVIAKSPAVLQDLDLIGQISRETWACVVFSIAFSATGPSQKIFEPAAAAIESRFAAMKRVSAAGIYTGTAMMPIMPLINDSDANMQSIVAQTARCNGQFVLAGGLVLGDNLEFSFHKSLRRIDRQQVASYERLYQGGFSPNDNSWSKLGLKTRALCHEYGLANRIKRGVLPGPLAENKRLAEKLFLKVYELEIDGCAPDIIEQMRKLAWDIDENPVVVNGRLLNEMMGKMDFAETTSISAMVSSQPN